jgi:hypothetical protein
MAHSDPKCGEEFNDSDDPISAAGKLQKRILRHENGTTVTWFVDPVDGHCMLETLVDVE